jgi:hypothetical protein
LKKLRRSNKRAAGNDYQPPRVGKSEGNLTARRETTAGTQSKGKHEQKTNARRAQIEQECRAVLLLGGILAASRRIEKVLVHGCPNTEWSLNQKRDYLWRHLVDACVSINASLLGLAIEFQESFRKIAEELPGFPCVFPAHVDHRWFLEKFMLDKLNLGKRYALKLRAAPGRKTFSTKTWVNKFLTDLIHMDEVPFTPENPKQWLDAIWERLLLLFPNPETHPRLRQLVDRPSLRTKRMRRDGTVGEKTQGHNMRAAIKAKLGEYLKRMLQDSAALK